MTNTYGELNSLDLLRLLLGALRSTLRLASGLALRLLLYRSHSGGRSTLSLTLLLALWLALGSGLLLDACLLAGLLTLRHAGRLGDRSVGHRVHLGLVAGSLALLVALGSTLSLGHVLLDARRLALLLALRHTLNRSSGGGVGRRAGSRALLLALRLAARRGLRSVALLLAGLLASGLALSSSNLKNFVLLTILGNT